LPSSPLAEQESDILAHMNADHADDLRAYCRHVHGIEAQRAEMIGIDPDGFDVRADQHGLRFDFDETVADAQAARRALVALSRTTRG
jgi:putative heme iron utilization protein